MSQEVDSESSEHERQSEEETEPKGRRTDRVRSLLASDTPSLVLR